MNRLMLINGRHVEELRVAVIEDNKLESFRVKAGDEEVERGNIYRGVVANVEGSLDAAFVDYGADKHGFLTRHDVITEAQHKPGKGRSKIDEILERGKPITVQVTRDAVDNKGAMLTTNISLAGRYLVLMPFDDSRGISRKVEDEATRRKLRDKVKGLIADDGNGYGFIVRTNAMEQDVAELKRDLDHLINLWKRVQEQGSKGSGPLLINDDQDLVVQALRDYLDGEIDEVVIDDEALLERAREYLDATMPDSPIKLTLYTERIPLFSRYNLESQITAIQQRVVPLPSGGSLVIDSTEALTAIDVNSGKATSGGSQGETAFNTNLEAAEEVARQIRLRDIGGLFVVDFIDMRAIKHQRKVEQVLKEALKQDKARTRVGRISDNGLLEINRQRIGQALRLRTHELCPTCKGVGRVSSPILAGLNLLRRIEARAATGRLKDVRVELHPQLADRIQNTRRQELASIESTYRVEISVIGTPGLELSEERLTWSNYDSPRWPKGKPPQQSRGNGRSGPQGRGDGKPTPQGRGDGKPAPQGRGDGKPAPQSRGDSQEESPKRGRRSRGRRRRGKLSTEAAPQQGEPLQQQDLSPEMAGPQGLEAQVQPAEGVRVAEETVREPRAKEMEQMDEQSDLQGDAPRETSSRRRRRRRRRRPTQDQPLAGQPPQRETSTDPGSREGGTSPSGEIDAQRTRPGRTRARREGRAEGPSSRDVATHMSSEQTSSGSPSVSPESTASAKPEAKSGGEASSPVVGSTEQRQLVILPLLPDTGGEKVPVSPAPARPREEVPPAPARPREEVPPAPARPREERPQVAHDGAAPREANAEAARETTAVKETPERSGSEAPSKAAAKKAPSKAPAKKAPAKKAPAKKAPAKKAPAKKAPAKKAAKKAPAKKAAKKAPAKKAAKKAPAKKAPVKKAVPKKKAAAAKNAEI